jgi:soluble lytic murein transglycosylase
VSRLAVLAFFLGPALLVAFAVSVRTSGALESYEAVIARVLRHRAAARAAAASEGVEASLLLAVAAAESAGRPDARSRAGAVGLMQLMPSTADEMAQARGEDRPDLHDPATSLRLGARYLRRQVDRFAQSAAPLEMAIAAYNAGPEKVQSWRDDGEPAAGEALAWIRYDETRAFVRRVLDYESRLRARAAPAR